ncbi:MAG: hypothetical protein ACYCXF_08445 [Thermoleophilia bacterium]
MSDLRVSLKEQFLSAAHFIKCPEILLPFMISRVAVIVISLIIGGATRIVTQSPGFLPSYLKVFAVWDGSWYLSIAEHGYHAHFDKIPDYVWFPLYPVLIRLFSFLTFGNYLVAAILISNLCLALAMVFVYRYTEIILGSRIARRSILYLSIFPLSFIFSIAYPASLLLLLCAAAFYFAETRRWAAAGLVGMLAAATNPLGVFISLPLLLLYMRKKGWLQKEAIEHARLGKQILWLAIIPLGIVGYYVYLYFLTGSFWADLDGEGHFGRSFGLFANTIVKSVKLAGESGSILALLDLSFIATYFALLAYMIWKKKFQLEHFLLAALFVLIPLSTGQTDGIGRYGMAAFPFFWALASLAENRPLFHRAYLSLAPVALVLLLLLVGTPLFVP